MRNVLAVACVCLLASPPLMAQQATKAADAARRDTSYIDADGTARVTRVVPVPKDLSPEVWARSMRGVTLCQRGSRTSWEAESW